MSDPALAHRAISALLAHLLEAEGPADFAPADAAPPSAALPLAVGLGTDGRPLFSVALDADAAALSADQIAAACTQASDEAVRLHPSGEAPTLPQAGAAETFRADTPHGPVTGTLYFATLLDALAAPDAPLASGPVGDEKVHVAQAAFADLGRESLADAGGDGSMHPAGFDLLREVELEITVELGRRSLPLAQVLRLASGSVLELDRVVGEPLGIYANGHLIAEGEAVVLGEQLGVRVTRLVAGAAAALPTG